MNTDWSVEPQALTEITSRTLARILVLLDRAELGVLEVFQRECRDVLAAFDEEWARTCTPSEPEPSASLIRYALVSLIDESVAGSNWPHRRPWENNSLELQFFDSDRRGKGFYERLDRQLKAPDVKPAVLLAYYSCLLIGFRGQYWHDEPSRAAVMDELRDRLAVPERVDLAALSPLAGPAEQPSPSKFARMPQIVQQVSLSLLAVVAAIYAILQWRY